jgi:antitoxin MazE
MQSHISRWGNSLGVRIPKDMARRIGLNAGDRVDIEADSDRIVIAPAAPRYRLEDLLVGMSPKAMRAAFDWGADAGREAIDE